MLLFELVWTPLNHELGRLGTNQAMAGHPTPSGQVFGNACILGDQCELCSRSQRIEAVPEFQHQLTAPHHPSIPHQFRLTHKHHLDTCGGKAPRFTLVYPIERAAHNG